MYASQQPAQRRRKKRHTHGLKTVEVARGRNGYGFTISGQHPCILSCIVSGSPADRMGLKTGDFLISVNNQDISQASHDEVVRMIGSSRGVLILQITENVNSSESSDDEFQARPKSKYPNRTRMRQSSSKPPPEDPAAYPRERKHGRHRRELPDPAKLRSLSPGRDGERRRTDKYDRYHHHDMRSMGIENIDPSSGNPPVSAASQPKRQKQVTTNDGIIRYRSPNTKHTIITREARLGKGQNNLDNFQPRGHPIGSSMAESSGHGASHRESRNPHRRGPQPQVHDDFPEEDSVLIGEYLRVVVGYVGTIGMARDSKNDATRMQSIRNAVHRLKVERKLTTMVLMELAANGVRLINTNGSTVAFYASEHIAFSGINSEDKRFFGIVTIHIETVDDPKMEGQDVSDSSCHVFKVNPELCAHNLHVHKARNFGIHCTVNPETQQCMEFPHSALPVMKCMSHFYRERPSALYETEMAHMGAFSRPNFPSQRQESNLNSESSASRGHKSIGQPNRGVCVVDLQSTSRPSDVSYHWDRESQNMYKFGDPNISAIYPDDRASGSGTSDFSIPPNPANTSESSQDNSIQLNTMERLHVRAMPDPRTGRSEPKLSLPGSGELQNNTSERQQGPHRMMLTRQQHLDSAQYGSEDMDTESIKSNESSQGTTVGSSDLGGAMPVPVGSRQLPPSSMRAYNDSRMVRPPALGVNTTATSLSSTRNDSYLESSYYVTSGPQGPNVSTISAISAISSTDSSMGTSSFDTTATPTPTPNSSAFSRPLPRPPAYPTRPVPLPPVLSYHRNGHTKRPPIPERQPIIPRKNPKTPLKTPLKPPHGKKPNRPKSTPPFKRGSSTPEEQEGYDSDPGSSILEGEDWSQEVPKQNKPQPVTRDARRFSEGYALSRQKEKMGEDEGVKKPASFRQNTDKPFRRSNLSNSHESLVVTDHDASSSHVSSRLNAAASVTAITNKGLVITRQANGSVDTVGRAASWAVSFEKLLRDHLGLQIFTDYLKKEYSEENIIFWKKCEQFRKITSEEERKKMAASIFNDHIAPGASEPVNVDSTARSKVEEEVMKEAAPGAFEVAQSQIFRLMKQDSYARFLKSEGYKACVVAEMEGKPLPLPEPDEANNNQMPKAPATPVDRWKKTMKKSKSSSSAEEPGEEKRRRSLLPWNKKDKAEKKISKTTTDPDLHRAPPAVADSVESKSRPSLDLADLSVMSKQVTGTQEEVEPSEVAARESHKFCRVILPDSSTTVIPCRAGQTIRQAVTALCDRRQLSMAVIHVSLAGTEQPLDMSRDLSSLGSKQIQLEKQVLFRMDLPQRKFVCVRAKPSQNIATVFSPILQRYGLQINSNLVMHVAGTGVILKDDQDVASLEFKQVIVQSLDDFKEKGSFTEWGSYGSHRGLSAKPPIPKIRGDPYKQGKSLDDVMNHMFKDILESMTTNLEIDSICFDENGVWDVSKYKAAENRNSGILGFIRRNSIGEKEGNKMKAKTHKVFSSVRQSGSKLPPAGAAPPLPVAPRGRGKLFDADDEKLFDLLSRAQSRQMDDQRGLTARDFELPDFLRVGGDGCNQGDYPLQPRSARELVEGAALDTSGRPRSAPTSRAKSVDCLLESSLLRHQRQSSDAQEQLAEGLMTPRTAKLASGNESFAQDGIMPTPNRATNYFTEDQKPSSPNFDDSKLMERSLRDLGLNSNLQGQGNSFNAFMSKGSDARSNMHSPQRTAGYGRHPGKPQPQPRVPHRQNPPGKSPEQNKVLPDPERLRSHPLPPSSDEDLDITLIPPSDSSCESDGGVKVVVLPSPPQYLNTSTFDDTERANFSPPTPILQVEHPGAKDRTNPDLSSAHSYHPVPAKRPQRPPVHSHVTHSHQTSSLAKAHSSDLDLEIGSATGSERSGPSTPSPTTHDLILDLDSGPEVNIPPPQPAQRGPEVNVPPPQPAQRGSMMKKPYETAYNNKAKKSLAFDRHEIKTDVQVSFV